ncbi:hypothetical protein FRB93_012806 [Tulasnella sp. JGI-2019a]|nr:hypothetical protein FRB93_012806 [Tulasnella sp. JGI-2019a]
MSQDRSHPMLFVPELLIQYMGYHYEPRPHSSNHKSVTRRAIDSAGQVCKIWREASLTVKFREADLLSVLLVLGPLEWDSGTDYNWVFKRPPTVDDWLRFSCIVPRVSKLTIAGNTRISESLIGTLYTTRPYPFSPLLPNVQSVKLSLSSVGLRLSLACLPLSVKDINIQLTGDNY